ncbi:AI-2E family transporter, partial [Streptomyces chartreusis]
VGALIAIPAVATLQAFLGAYVKRYDVTDDPRVHGHRGRGQGLFARARELWIRPPDKPGKKPPEGTGGSGRSGDGAD